MMTEFQNLFEKFACISFFKSFLDGHRKHGWQNVRLLIRTSKFSMGLVLKLPTIGSAKLYGQVTMA
jgi:hypothetical protein